jgi:hypothetical protein
MKVLKYNQLLVEQKAKWKYNLFDKMLSTLLIFREKKKNNFGLVPNVNSLNHFLLSNLRSAQMSYIAGPNRTAQIRHQCR